MKRSLLFATIVCTFSFFSYSQNKEAILAKISWSLVQLTTDEVIGNGICIASNIVVCPISTIGKYTNVQAHLSNGKTCKILGFTFADMFNDFALLKTDYDSSAPIKMATYNPKTGQKVFLANKSPEGNIVLTEGRIRDVKDFGTVKLIEAEAPSQFHSAGLPVLDSLGDMIGLLVPPPIEDSKSNFSIPVELIKKAAATEENLRKLDMLEPFFENLKHISIAGNKKSKAVSEFFDQGILKLNHKDYQGAIEKFNMAIRVSPSDADAYAFRGQAKSQMMQYKDALLDFNKALELQPEYAEVLDMRGICKAELGDKTGACEDWKLSYEKGFNPAFKLIEKFCDLK